MTAAHGPSRSLPTVRDLYARIAQTEHAHGRDPIPWPEQGGRHRSDRVRVEIDPPTEEPGPIEAWWRPDDDEPPRREWRAYLWLAFLGLLTATVLATLAVLLSGCIPIDEDEPRETPVVEVSTESPKSWTGGGES